jgi:hypothetical protein
MKVYVGELDGHTILSVWDIALRLNSDQVKLAAQDALNAAADALSDAERGKFFGGVAHMSCEVQTGPNVLGRLLAAGIDACPDKMTPKPPSFMDKPKTAVDVERQVEEMLTYVTCSKTSKMEGLAVRGTKMARNKSGGEYISASIGRGLDPSLLFIERDLSGLHGPEAMLSLPEGDDTRDILTSVRMKDIGRLDYGTITTAEASPLLKEEGLSVLVERFRSVGKDVVRAAGPGMRFNFIHSMYSFYPDGTMEATRNFVASSDDVKYFRLAGGRATRDKARETLLKFQKGLAFRAVTRWFVWLTGGTHWIKIATDAEGARAFFTDRAAEGNRRKALLHWVTGHYRKHRKDASTLTWVREHLRGKQDFEWHGLGCRLIPAVDDVKVVAPERAEVLLTPPPPPKLETVETT